MRTNVELGDRLVEEAFRLTNVRTKVERNRYFCI
ncbi:type II toxin-antitoxin system VapB family antitoxin [Chroococcidiopsis sp. FACHB-1243]|nr:type II toxin-antitoxin system VapB family antitoxin [Chroococcidiopsis sp. [FACHB-1243]]MBD2305230.1 type II toxin-antitoxin system VapB family antitoxin [Chroococcidiopsis sp. [FACHB-1243]]